MTNHEEEEEEDYDYDYEHEYEHEHEYDAEHEHGGRYHRTCEKECYVNGIGARIRSVKRSACIAGREGTSCVCSQPSRWSLG